MQTDAGRSIYEDSSPLFMSDQQAEYYRDESTLDAARDKLAWVIDRSRGSGRLLDVGANFGYFVREAAGRFEALGIEPGALTVAWGREHLGAPLQVGSIYDDRPDFTGRFDVITLFDVIEHLPDPRAALARCATWLAPKGRVFITTPDASSLMARLLGAHWYYVDLKEHISLFNRRNLRRLLADAGYEVVAIRTFGRRYKLSYVERRLAQLAGTSRLLAAARMAAQPLRLVGDVRVRINLGDVMGIVAERRAF